MIFFPAIVLDGKLFEAVGPSNRLKLFERNHVLLFFSRRSKTLGEDKSFIVDVVTKNYFRPYTALIVRDIRIIRNYFTRYNKRLMNEADYAVNNLP
jgi:hypothetical protein